MRQLHIINMILFRQETAEEEEMARRSAQPFEKAQFAEGRSLDFASPDLDFPSLRLGFSFLEAWIFLPRFATLRAGGELSGPREPDEQ